MHFNFLIISYTMYIIMHIDFCLLLLLYLFSIFCCFTNMLGRVDIDFSYALLLTYAEIFL